MKKNSKKILELVDEDFTLRGSGRWRRTVEHDSLVVDSERGLFFWNSRDIKGDALTYLLKVRKLPKSLAISMLGSSYIVPETKEIKVIENIKPHLKLVDALWKRGKNNRIYWYNRLLTDKTIDLFKLGYYEGWYTIPIINNNKLENIQQRRDIPDKRVLAWYKKEPSLFNVDVLSLFYEIILTEGIVDSIYLNQIGIPAMSKSSGALTWLDKWSKFFIRTTRIYLVFDNDDPGRRGAKRVAEKLGIYKCKIFTFAGEREKYDVIDFFKDGRSKEEFMKLIKNNSKYSFEL